MKGLGRTVGAGLATIVFACLGVGVGASATTDTTPPALVASGPLEAKAGKGLYDASYALHVEASDTQSGISRVEIFVDGVTQSVAPGSCSGACGVSHDWTMSTDGYADGARVIRVVATDQATNVTERSWTVTVDRRGGIYVARQYNGDPATTGELGGIEWAKPTKPLRARREGNNGVKALWVGPCPGNSPTPQCAYGTGRSADVEDEPELGDSYWDHRHVVGDERVDLVATMLEPLHETPTVIYTEGPIGDALEPWQTPPPGHGPLYRYEEAVDGETGNPIHRWVDGMTSLPLKAFLYEDGVVIRRSYWSYELNRLEDSQVPFDHWTVPIPANVEYEEYVDSTGSGGPPPTLAAPDAETGVLIEAASVGDEAQVLGAVGGEVLCEVGVDRVQMRDHVPAAPPPTTYLVASYEQPSPAGCLPGDDGAPRLIVMTMARGSSYAAAHREAYEPPARLIQSTTAHRDHARAGVARATLFGRPATAFVVPVGPGRASALVEVDSPFSPPISAGPTGVSIVVTGAFDKRTIAPLVAQLEVAR
jgi:hypothetical protein